MDRLELSWKMLAVVGFFGLVTGMWFVFIRSSIVMMPSDANFAGIDPTELKSLHPNLFRWMGYVFVTFGTFISGLSLLSIWVALTAYRKREKWSWCALATTDIIALSASLVNVVLVGSDLVVIVAPMLILMIAALALSAKDFLKQ